MKRVNFIELKSLPLNTLVVYNDLVFYISGVSGFWVCLNKTKLERACPADLLCSCDEFIGIYGFYMCSIFLPESEEEIAMALLRHY